MFSRSIYIYRVHTMALGLYRKETRVEMRYQKKCLQLYSQTDWYLLPNLIGNEKQTTMEYSNIHVTVMNLIMLFVLMTLLCVGVFITILSHVFLRHVTS